MGRLILCSASAGTGKTYSVCEHVVRWILDGGEPERLLATTFTRKAASELKERIQRRILEETSLPFDRRLELAERLELAAIGTVHSIGHQILSRHAFQLGLSPSLAVADEAAQTRHMARLLAELPPAAWVELTARAHRLGIDKPEELVLELLDEKRANAIADDAFVAQLEAGASRVCELLGTPDTNAPDPARLYDHIAEALDAVDARNDSTKETAGARDKLRRLLSARSGTWQDYAACAPLKAGKRSGANEALEPLRSYAARVRVMPRLHQDVREFTRGVAAYVVALSRAYADYKASRGLLDYTDLETHLLRLLTDEARADELRASLGLVIVDEFQDTSPLQLAIFLRLRELAEESYWVGDPKQAIYGFRGADADLMRSVWEHARAEERRRLETCYRSQDGLVQLYNSIFEPSFGANVRLRSAKGADGPALERRLLPSQNLDEDWAALACVVREMRDEGVPLRDIAILVRTNRHARDAATALRNEGLAASVPLPGLLDTRECRIALAGLRLAADPRDSLAAATVVHFLAAQTEETPPWLDARLREARALDALPKDERDATPFANDERLRRLREAPHAARGPAQTLLDVIAHLDLPGQIARWDEPARRAAHLDALVALARRFEDEAVATGTPATVLGLARWLETLAEDEKDELPTPTGLDAVTVLTGHKAKGLQWPVVILPAFTTLADPDPWAVHASGGDPARGLPLEGRRIRYWCWPFGFIKGRFGRRHSGCGLEDAAAESPEGRALAQAHSAESKRLAYVAFTRAERRVVLAQRDRKSVGGELPDAPLLALVPRVDEVAPLDAGPGTHHAASHGLTFTVRGGASTAEPAVRRPGARWIASAWAPTSVAPPRYVNPSSAPPVAGSTADAGDALGGSLPPIKTAKVDALGKAAHAYYAALPSLEDASTVVKHEVALRCIAGFDVAGDLTPDALVAAGERLVAWVKQQAPGAEMRTEVGITAPRADGAQWVGVADLLLFDADKATIVDHKSTGSAARGGDVEAFSGQLAAYVAMLEAAGLAVGAPWVHLPYAGRVRRVALPAPASALSHAPRGLPDR